MQIPVGSDNQSHLRATLLVPEEMKHLVATLLIPVLISFSACRPNDDDHAGHDHSGKGHSHAAGEHHHEPPHGGTPVALGDEAFHLELVNDAETGTLTAYVMDGHLENFIRIPNQKITIEITGAEKIAPLSLQPVANSATGETVGDTSQFSATADWLKTATNFDAVIPRFEIREQTFTNVTFNFPKGNE